MGYLRFRRTKTLGHGVYVTVTQSGVRIGLRTKRGTVSDGTSGRSYASAHLGKGLTWVIKN